METKYYFGLGRRKTAVAKVRIYPGRGSFRVNNLDITNYFSKPFDTKYVNSPFDIVDAVGKFDTSVYVYGGGSMAQLEAVRHGITRALLRYDAGLRHLLRQAGFVTRDPRGKERKKPGLKGARRAPQWSKR